MTRVEMENTYVIRTNHSRYCKIKSGGMCHHDCTVDQVNLYDFFRGDKKTPCRCESYYGYHCEWCTGKKPRYDELEKERDEAVALIREKGIAHTIDWQRRAEGFLARIDKS